MTRGLDSGARPVQTPRYGGRSCTFGTRTATKWWPLAARSRSSRSDNGFAQGTSLSATWTGRVAAVHPDQSGQVGLNCRTAGHSAHLATTVHTSRRHGHRLRGQACRLHRELWTEPSRPRAARRTPDVPIRVAIARVPVVVLARRSALEQVVRLPITARSQQNRRVDDAAQD